jgi:hypothetical protein
MEEFWRRRVGLKDEEWISKRRRSRGIKEAGVKDEERQEYVQHEECIINEEEWGSVGDGVEE